MTVYLVIREEGASYEGTFTDILGWRPTLREARDFAESLARDVLGNSDSDIAIREALPSGARFVDSLAVSLDRSVKERRRWVYSWTSGAECLAPSWEDDWPVLTPLERAAIDCYAARLAEESKHWMSVFRALTDKKPEDEP